MSLAQEERKVGGEQIILITEVILTMNLYRRLKLTHEAIKGHYVLMRL